MFNVTKIQANLYGVVGWRQPLNPAYPTIDASNLGSTSGEYVTNNPHCKIEYLYDNQDYKDLSDAEFNTKLKEMQEDSIASVCHKVFNKPDFIDRQLIYQYANNKTETETLPSGFVCFKIQVAEKKNIAFEISRILLNFEGSGDVKILLFNSAQSTPIEEQNVTITSTHQVVDLNWKVDNSGDTYKGEYYLGYLSNDVAMGTLKPYKRDYNNSDIMANITHLQIDKYSFNGHTTETIPDLESEDGMDENLGLNPDITVYKDATDLIKQNKALLSHAINLDLQIKCLEMYMASLRSNINQMESERKLIMIINEIEGINADVSGLKITGLRPELSRAISGIQKEIAKLQDGYFGGRLKVVTMR